MGIFNFKYIGFLCLKLGIKYSLTTNFSCNFRSVKYTVVFLILVFYTSFSIIFGILEGLFRVLHYPSPPPTRLPLSWPTLTLIASSRLEEKASREGQGRGWGACRPIRRLFVHFSSSAALWSDTVIIWLIFSCSFANDCNLDEFIFHPIRLANRPFHGFFYELCCP